MITAIGRKRWKITVIGFNKMKSVESEKEISIKEMEMNTTYANEIEGKRP